MHNKVMYRIIRARNGKIEQHETINLRVNTGTNWQAETMGGTAALGTIQNIALTEDATAASASDTTLAGEITTDGLSRTTATFSHTADQSLYTLTASWQNIGSVYTIAKAAQLHDAALVGAGASSDTMFVETLLSPVAVLASNDTLEIAWGVSV